MMKTSPVVHFEMPYKNAKRVSKFYQSVFEWKMNDAGADMGHYLVAQTTQTDKNNMVTRPGTINGGLYDLKQSPKSKEPSIVISVNNVEKAMKAVVKAGGKLLAKKPQDIPGIGLWVSFRDTEGNRVSILQATAT
jgi:predicted enzyme related to lactoylglutathione lyase